MTTSSRPSIEPGGNTHIQPPSNWPDNITYIASIEYADDSLEPRRTSRGPPCGCQPHPSSCSSCECVLFACQEECRANCTAGEFCGNKRITKQQWKKVEIRRCPMKSEKGFGLYAAEDVNAGDLVIEYVGMVQGAKYLKSREYLFPERFDSDGGSITTDGERDFYSHANHRYIMSLDASMGLFLDARYKGNQARFTNHSCVPNCKMDRWKVRGVTRIALFAIKDIKQGTELTFDYAWERALPQHLTKCLCGESTCRGTLEIGVLDPSEHIEADESDDLLGSQEIHSHWIKPPTHTEYIPPIGSTIKIFFEKNAEYFVAEVLEHDEKNHGNVRVCFENDGEECWENIADRNRYLIQEKSAMRVEKRLTTPYKHRPLLSSTTPQPLTSSKLASETVYVSEPIRELLVENLIIQKCENFFQLSAEITNVGENVCIQLSGQQASNAAEYLKRNVISLQQHVVPEQKTAYNETFSFSKISKRPHRIAFIPDTLTEQFKSLEPYFKSQFQNCNMRIITEAKDKVEKSSSSDGSYLLFEASSASDLQSIVTTVNQYINLFWFSGDIVVNSEIHPMLKEFLTDPLGVISSDIAADENDSYFHAFQVDNKCKLLFYVCSSDSVSCFINTSHPNFIESIFSKIQGIFVEIMSGTKYIIAPSLYGDEKFLQWLQGFGAHVSYDLHSKVAIKVKKNQLSVGISSTSALAIEAIKTQQKLSNRDFLRKKQWSYGVDSPSCTDDAPYLADTTISELADLCSSLKLDAGTAVHALVILKRFLIMKGTQSKIRETLLACFYIANKSQKMHKWKKLEQVLQKAYSVWYNGNTLDIDSEEAAVVAKRILSIEATILRSLHYHIFYENNVDNVILILQKHSTCSSDDVDKIRRLLCSFTSLRCMWEYKVPDVIISLWVLLLQCDLSPILSKYNVSIDQLISVCQSVVTFYSNDSSKRSKILDKMKSNFDALQVRKSQILSLVELDLGSPFTQLHIVASDDICDALIRLDNDEATMNRLTSCLGNEVSLSVVKSGFKLTTYSSDCRCLFVTYQLLLGLLESQCDVTELTPKFSRGISKTKSFPSSTHMAHPLNSSIGGNSFHKQSDFKGTLTGKTNISGAYIGHILGTKHGISDLEPLYESRALKKTISIESLDLRNIERVEGTFSLLPWPSDKVAQRELSRPGKFSMGVSAASLQELYLLHQLLPHSNFIRPLNIYSDEIGRRHLVVTEIVCSLQTILNRRKHQLSVSPLLIRCWMKDVTAAMARCHENFINIRTLNPDNILITHNGLAQLSNLNCCSIVLPSEVDILRDSKNQKGLFDDRKDSDKLSDAYVAPEILLGLPNYTLQSDIWCLAAVLSYLFLSKPLIPPRRKPVDYIASVYKIVGSPSEKNWLECKNLPFYKKYKPSSRYKRGVEKALNSMITEVSADSNLAIACLSKLLFLNPSERADPAKILESDAYLNFDLENVGDAFSKDWRKLKQQLENLEIYAEVREEELVDESEILTPSLNRNGNDPKRKVSHQVNSRLSTPFSSEKKSTNDFLNDLAPESEESDTEDLYYEKDILLSKRKKKKRRKS